VRTGDVLIIGLDARISKGARMKLFRVVAAVLLGAGAAWAFQGKPVNDECPVKGEPVKPGITTTWNGKTVGFC
jgi:hypothetical protein